MKIIIRSTPFLTFIFFLLNISNPGFAVLIEEEHALSGSQVLSSERATKNFFNEEKNELEIHDWKNLGLKIEDINKIRSVFVREKYEGEQEVESLQQISSLEFLRFVPFGCNDDSVLKIMMPVLSNLIEFRAPLNRMGDKGLKLLCTLATKLKILDLTQDLILTDEGINFIPAFSNLEELSLANTNITDGSIPYLMQLRKLKKLNIVGTRITKEGLNDLRNTIPALKEKGAIQANKL